MIRNGEGRRGYKTAASVYLSDYDDQLLAICTSISSAEKSVSIAEDVSSRN